MMVAEAVAQFDGNEKIGFVFDQQVGFREEAFLGWQRLRDYAKSRGCGDVLGDSYPMFLSDQEFMPLQAADTYAWYKRRKLEGNVVRPAFLEGLLSKLVLEQILTEDALRLAGQKVRDHVAEFSEQYPWFQMVPAGKKARRVARKWLSRDADPSSSEDAG